MKVIGYIVILTLILGALAAIYHAGEISEREKHQTALNKLELALDNQRIEYEKATNSMAAALLDRKVEREIIYEEIEKKIPVYITKNPECDINYGGYSLLYSAFNEHGEQEGKYSALTDAEKKEAAITQAQLFRVTTSCGKEYNDTVDQLHTLQEAVKKLDCVISE